MACKINNDNGVKQSIKQINEQMKIKLEVTSVVTILSCNAQTKKLS
jgi:hypothetical protein